MELAQSLCGGIRPAPKLSHDFESLPKTYGWGVHGVL